MFRKDGRKMATCKECIHQSVCKVYGALFPKRTDVDKICDHYLCAESLMGFDAFWSKVFAQNK